MRNTKGKKRVITKKTIKRGVNKTKSYISAAAKNATKNVSKGTKFVTAQTVNKLQNARKGARNLVGGILQENEDFLKKNLETVVEGIKKLEEKDKKRR